MFPTRRSYAALALAFIAFALYGSLVPFDVRPLPVDTAWTLFRSGVMTLPTGRISRTDLLANILLFVPVGFSLSASLLVDGRRWPSLLWAVPAVLAVSITVSMAAEFLQLFTSDRVPSGSDIAAQIVGCLAGILVWIAAGQALTAWTRTTLAAAPQDRLARALTAYAFIWTLANLAPFDITVDLGNLAERVRSGRISVIPFGSGDLSLARRAWDSLAEVLSTIPLGAFGVFAFSASGQRRTAGAIAVGAGIVALVELAQVFVRSHSADSGDVILGCLGVAIGVWASRRLRPESESRTASVARRMISWRALALAGAWCCVLAAYHWMPYDFTMDTAAIRRKLTEMSLLPFAGYRGSSYLNALNDLVTKLALAVPLGTAIAYAVRSRALAQALALLLAMLAAAGIFGVIEGGQFFLPSRVPDPTDVLVGMAGTGIGLMVGRWLRDSSQ